MAKTLLTSLNGEGFGLVKNISYETTNNFFRRQHVLFIFGNFLATLQDSISMIMKSGKMNKSDVYGSTETILRWRIFRCTSII